MFAKKQIPHQFVMTSARWQAIVKIFEDALEKPQGDRDEFVREACAEDPDIEAEVARLLTADEDAGSFLEGPVLSTLPPRSTLNRKPTFLASGSLVSGRFEVVRFIGQGGMGQVYEALDLELKGKVALKAIREDISSDPQMLARFRREVFLTRRITHPNVCRTFDIERHSSIAADGTNSDITFLTMELLEGETLADLLRRQGRLATTEALPLVLQMIEALSAAHSVGIVHRDFKPSNVLLVPISNGLRVVVTDFGLARAILPNSELSGGQAATSLTGSQRLMGTLVYMAPEQFERGEATVASDTYSLGLVMYEMVTGERPFADAIPFAEAAKRIKQPAPSPKILVPDLDAGWEGVICRCLQTQPEDRFKDVRQVGESIRVGNHERSAAGILHLRGFQERLAIRTSSSFQHKNSWRRLGIPIAVFVLGVSLSVLFLRYYRVRSDAKLAGGSTVLLTEIQNSTGDGRFDGTTELVRHQLSQSAYFNLMDTARIRSVLTQMTKPPDAQLDPQTAREIALRVAAPRVIFGVVSRVGDSYVLDIDIEQPDSNPRRAREQWEKHWTWNSGSTSDKEIPGGFLAAVRDSADWIRSEVGEAASDIARMDAPPQDVTTADWEALSEFAQAEKFKGAGQVDNAIVALRNAVSTDPHFALAYMRLGDLLFSVSRSREAYAAYQSALSNEKQQRLTRREKDRLLGIYANDTEDYKTAETAFRDYTVYYPHDYLGWFYRGTPLMKLGRLEEAIASLKKAEEIDSSKMFAPATIARFDLMSGDFEDASRRIDHLRETGYVDDADLDEGQLDFVQGHYQESLAHFANLKGSKQPFYPSYGYSLLARLFAEMGQYGNALQALKDGADVDLKAGDTIHHADKLLDRAYINFKRGQYEACLQDTNRSLDLDRSLQRSLSAATLLGQAAFETTGTSKSKFALELRTIEANLPSGDFRPFSDIVRAHLRGEVLLAAGRWEAALAEFRKADRLEAPEEDKEYLARGLLSAAQHSSDPAVAARLRADALVARLSVALRPGLVWQWAQSYFPGYASDELISAAQLMADLKTLNPEMKMSLEICSRRRDHADLGTQNQARILLQSERYKN
jgi:serine/threonine protein kinase/tetratricopeptide (TPR) repeat protein